MKGFTLFEVLVALVIYSLGMLGIAALQITSLQFSHDSQLRSAATNLAADMADRMRSNRGVIASGTASPYNNPTGAATGNPACLGLNASGAMVASNTCTPAQMAANDFYQWYSKISGRAATGWHPVIAAELPAGNGVVCIDSTPTDGTTGAAACDNIIAVPNQPIYAIKLWWRERIDDQTVVRSYVTSFSL